MKKDLHAKILKRFDGRLFSAEAGYIYLLSFGAAALFTFFVQPSKVDEMKGIHVNAVLLMFSISHALFVWRVFPRVALFLSSKGSNLLVAATVTCLGANSLVMLARFAFIPTKANGIEELAFLCASILISAMVVTLPGWIIYVLRNLHHLTAAIELSGIVTKVDLGALSSNDDLQKLLPVSRRGKLLFLKAEGNYTEIVTTTGSYLMRIGIGKAEAMTSDNGLRVHKSHWVSLDELVAISYVAGKPWLVTQSGRSLPVSRSMIPAIRRILERL